MTRNRPFAMTAATATMIPPAADVSPQSAGAGPTFGDADRTTHYLAESKPAQLNAELLTIETTLAPKVVPSTQGLAFGSVFSDHMLEVEWTKQAGWATPKIVPFHNIEMHPAAHALHYAAEIFEGMKAYCTKARHNGGSATSLFRPLDNMIRMNLSASRMLLPTFDPVQMVELIKRYVEIEQRWVPEGVGHSLYLRPTLISMQDRSLALSQTEKALFYVIATPVGPYFADGFRPVKLFASSQYTRAHHGATSITVLHVLCCLSASLCVPLLITRLPTF